MELTETGYKNVIAAAEYQTGLRITKEFIDENMESFINRFPEMEYKNILPQPHDHSFIGEANSGSIHDTCTRGLLADVLANHFVGREWPLNMEGPEVGDKFRKDLYKSVSGSAQVIRV